MDLSNFDCNMPGGCYRDPGALEYDDSPEKLELYRKIDEYMKEAEYDVEQYKRINRIADRNFERFLHFTERGLMRRAKHYSRRSLKFIEILEPVDINVYERMLELGFSKALLTG